MGSPQLEGSVVLRGLTRDAEEEANIKSLGSQGGTKIPTDGPPAAANFMVAAKRCVLFRGLKATEIKYVQQTARLFEAKEGTILYKQGDTPSMCYLVHSGTYLAVIEAEGAGSGGHSSFGRAAGSLEAGSRLARAFGPLGNFGASELLCQMGDRTHTVKVVETGFVWGIPQRVVQNKLKIAPRLADTAEVIQCFEAVAAFRAIRKERLVQLSRAAVLIHVRPGEAVFEQGDMADAVFVVLYGSVSTRETKNSFRLTIKENEFFGESALFPDEDMRTRGTAICGGGGKGATLIQLPAAGVETLIGFELQQMVSGLADQRLLSKTTYNGRSLADGLSKYEIECIVNAMEVRYWSSKQLVVPDGEADEALFIIRKGSANVYRSKDKKVLAVLQSGGCFGEQALANTQKKHRRKMRVQLGDGDVLVTLALTKESLEQLVAVEPGIARWAEELAASIQASAIWGVDSSIALEIKRSGLDLDEVLSAQGKGGGRRSRGLVRDAVAPSIDQPKKDAINVPANSNATARRPSIVQKLRRPAPPQSRANDGAVQVPAARLPPPSSSVAAAKTATGRRRSFVDIMLGKGVAADATVALFDEEPKLSSESTQARPGRRRSIVDMLLGTAPVDVSTSDERPAPTNPAEHGRRRSVAQVIMGWGSSELQA